MKSNGLRADLAAQRKEQAIPARCLGSDVACRRCTAAVPIYRAAKQQGYCDHCRRVLTGN